MFTVWEPPNRFALTLIGGLRIIASMAQRVEINPVDGRCAIIDRRCVEPGKGFGWIGKPAVKRFERRARTALDRLTVMFE